MFFSFDFLGGECQGKDFRKSKHRKPFTSATFITRTQARQASIPHEWVTSAGKISQRTAVERGPPPLRWLVPPYSLVWEFPFGDHDYF